MLSIAVPSAGLPIGRRMAASEEQLEVSPDDSVSVVASAAAAPSAAAAGQAANRHQSRTGLLSIATSMSMAAASDDSDASTLDWVNSLPKAIQVRLRLAAQGPGKRLRDCMMCLTPSNAFDPVLGEKTSILWGHMETSKAGGTKMIQGFCCLYCIGLLRRRYKGHKQNELKDKLNTDEEEKTKFHAWRDAHIASYKENGFGSRMCGHLIDGDVSVKQKVEQNSMLEEKFKLQGPMAGRLTCRCAHQTSGWLFSRLS